jgi:hypothetical protein
MTRLVWLVALGLIGPRVAHAEGMLPGGATIKYNRLLLHEDNAETAIEPKVDPDSLWKYTNLAHCVCSHFNYDPSTADPAYFEKSLVYELTVENSTMPVDRPAEVWVGTDCANPDSVMRNNNCTRVVTTPNVSAIEAANGLQVEIPLYDLMTPALADRMGCQERVLSATTWVMVDADADSMFEYHESTGLATDSEPPPLPSNFSALGAEEAVEISWDPLPGGTDVAYYQALCATEGGAPAKTNPPDPRYQTARMLCKAEQDIPLVPSDISSNTGVDAGTAISLGEDLAKLDGNFICGETTSPTATNLRIEGLANGTAYTVVLLAIDKYGNASGTYFTSRLVPVPATDFWEDLHERGSGVEGGFCLIAQAYGDGNPLTHALRGFRDHTLARTAFGRWLIDVYYNTIGSLNLHGSVVLRVVVAVVLLPLVALALLWHLLTLPGLLGLVALLALARWRRHLRRAWRLRLATAATVACIALVPTRASAQTPYWEDPYVADNDTAPSPDDPARVKWHAGIRVGPYIPAIDAQLGMPTGGADGPYEQMFGGYSIMPVLDLERFLWTRMGQLGVAFSIGYMGKKAHPWQAGSSPSDPNRPRANGDDNSFRLFPLSLGAVYRFSYLDDEYGIPVVPYARGGLAYYIWWVTAPNGDFAEACVGTATMCTTSTAAGASLGLVGSVGLAIRAERIDADAARSMRESGIEHAGFYAEYSIGKVDGFGSDSKLAVGDATWFAGVDFEF